MTVCSMATLITHWNAMATVSNSCIRYKHDDGWWRASNEVPCLQYMTSWAVPARARNPNVTEDATVSRKQWENPWFTHGVERLPLGPQNGTMVLETVRTEKYHYTMITFLSIISIKFQICREFTKLKVLHMACIACETGTVPCLISLFAFDLYIQATKFTPALAAHLPNTGNSGLAGPWNRGIIAHQTPHFRRPPKHVNNKGPLVFAQTFCTAWFISLENLHIYSKTYAFSNTFEGFRPKCTFRGCFSKYRRTFIVYMFRRPPEMWSLMSDNALISGTGKVGIITEGK